MRAALLVSIVVHVAVLIGARPIAAHLARLAPEAALDAAALEADRLTGTSIEVSTGLEDLAGGSQAAGAQQVNAGGTVPAAAPTETGPAPAETAAPSASAAPSAAPAATSAPSAAPSASAGSAPSVAPSAAAKPKARRPRKKKPAPSGSAAPAASAGASASPAGSGDPAAPAASATVSGTGTGSGGAFGPSGEATKRDLGRAFTRAIPYACAGDALWSKVTVGDAGTLRAAIHVDAEGHVTGAEPIGEDAPKHLVSLLRRSVGQLAAGIFAVRSGAVSAGTQTVEIKATVSSEPGDDALAFEYEGGRGKASFVAKGGRRVDVHVRVVSVKVDP